MGQRSIPVRLARFFRTPKGLLTIVLVVLAAVGASREAVERVTVALASGVGVASLVDAPLLRWTRRRWEFPSGAVLTALLVGMVLSPYEPWYVSPAASALAVVSKYCVRARSRNLFNPAAVGLVATFHMFDAAHSWWGALPEVAPALAWPLLLATGAFITDRVKRVPLVLAFLGSYFLLFTIAAFVGAPSAVAEVFITPELQAALFFAFFMLTDPPTSPARYSSQIACGAVVAVVSCAVFVLAGVAYYLLAGVLVGNLFEAWQRWRRLPRVE
jgi:Na+-translocating ferredoxin:NAD+ oxidoreductase RnfD subunit